MGDVSPRILSRLNGYYCREARTLIPLPFLPPRRTAKTTYTHMRSNTMKERRRGVDDDVDGMCNAVRRVVTKRGVSLAELTRWVP